VTRKRTRAVAQTPEIQLHRDGASTSAPAPARIPAPKHLSTREPKHRQHRSSHFVYIVRCGDGTLYTGYALDPTARTGAHNSGRGARYTASRRPVELVYVERCRTKNQALRRECELKRLTRTRKEELIRCQ
jgi:putative endonuclease